MSFYILPYELVVAVVGFLGQTDLLVFRQTCRDYYPVANQFLFYHLHLNERKVFRTELDSKFGCLVRRLTVQSATSSTLGSLNLLKCHGLFEMVLSRAEVDEEIVASIVSNHRKLRTFKICLGDSRHLSFKTSMWAMLDQLRYLETLHLFYVSHTVAEHLFYALPCLKDFRVKLVSGQEGDEVKVAYSNKCTFYNRNLTTLHVESWVKDVEIDRHLIWSAPNAFQSANQDIDYVRNDEDGALLALNCPRLESFRCMMWNASGEKLNSLLELANLSRLGIESSLSQDSFVELKPAPRILRLQMGVVNFSKDTLVRLGQTFPSVQHVQLGHCKPDQHVADAILSQEINLGWLSLATFQLNAVVAAIAARAPSLESLSYEMPSKACDPIKFKRLANLPKALKILKLSEPPY
ncbi:hypothetical protein L0F63_004943 [Massospora cicadina]|nr:hypothetical protein L0F63_004943 [Massospora cicadina]